MEYKIVMRDSLNCLQSVLASIAQTWKRNYHFMFMCSWDFNYSIDVNGERRVYSGSNDAKKNMNLFHNIVTTQCNVFEFIEIFEKEKGERSCGIIGVDTFFLPWSSFFQQAHYQHYVVVTDIRNSILSCIDTFEYGKKGELDLREDILIEYYKVRERTQNDTIPCWGEFLHLISSHIMENKSISKMFEFSKQLFFQRERMDFLYDKNIDSNFVLYQIGELSKKRENMAFLCGMVNEIYKENMLLELQEDMKKCAHIWKKIQSMLALCIMMNAKEEYLFKASCLIENVAEKEEKMIKKIEYCRNGK